MDILRKKSMEQLIDELGTKDIKFMKQLLKDLAKLDLYEQIELDEDMDSDDAFYLYYDMSQKIEDEVKYYNNSKTEVKKRGRVPKNK